LAHDARRSTDDWPTYSARPKKIDDLLKLTGLGRPLGSNHQNGANLIYEPLAYYSAFADKTHMWLAERYEFAPISSG
jgi:hypothetical protein